MAVFGRIFSKHPKYLFNLSLPIKSILLPSSSRLFSIQNAESSITDGSLIQEAAITQESRVSSNEPKTFEELFRKSAFVALGNPKGKIVVGTVRRVVEDNIYIDFGWKFPCVCPKPAKGAGSYVRGKKVRVLIRELEVSSKFLGSPIEITLNEADCVLLGLHGDQTTKSTAAVEEDTNTNIQSSISESIIQELMPLDNEESSEQASGEQKTSAPSPNSPKTKRVDK